MQDKIKKFKFWCNNILPLVYDDSLSYYEALCKFVAKLNETIEQVNALTQAQKDFLDLISKIVDDFTKSITDTLNQWQVNINNQISEWQTIMNQWDAYIKSQLSDAHLQSLINLRINQLLQDGTITNLIYYSEQFQTWLTQQEIHIDEYFNQYTTEINQQITEINQEITIINGSLNSTGAEIQDILDRLAALESRPQSGNALRVDSTNFTISLNPWAGTTWEANTLEYVTNNQQGEGKASMIGTNTTVNIPKNQQMTTDDLYNLFKSQNESQANAWNTSGRQTKFTEGEGSGDGWFLFNTSLPT